ncbi:MAG: helix-hairpin-helix domain-containing protein, partial [Solirubrobacteraceae bacterium]
MSKDPTNLEIAAAFDELADLYELDGAVVHRVMAYRGAAKTARDASASIAGLTRAGRVTELPGIGKTLAEKLTDLLETGSIPAAEKLRARYPAGLLEMTRLPGLGPKRARRLFDELGIESLEMLRAAAEEHRLREVRGFGAKFEDSVLSAIAAGAGQRPAGEQRVLLHRALEVGEQIVAG